MATVNWEEAIRSFLLHEQATKAAKTVMQRRTCTTQLAHWCEDHDISLQDFGMRDLDEYIVLRQQMGLKPKTVYHDAVSAKVFTKYCKHYDLLERDPLSTYMVRNPPEIERWLPTSDDMKRLLKVAHDFWDVKERKSADRSSVAKRASTGTGATPSS